MLLSVFAEMSTEESRRIAIVECLRAGRAPAEIVAFLNYPTATVYRVAKRFRDAEEEVEGSGTAARKNHDRMASRKRSNEFLNQLQQTIDADPSISQRSLAHRLNVSEGTIRTAVQQDLRYKSYVLRLRQLLTTATKERRLAKCLLLVSSMKHETAGHLRFFSDEKIFSVDAKINRRNDRWLASDAEDVPIICRSKHPASIHVLLAVSSDGDVMEPHFFQHGQTITKEVYLAVLKDVVKPWVVQVADGRPYVFQQDGAPAHNSRIVQTWCEDEFHAFWSKELWPPSSPDINPLDYHCWGVVERQSNKRAHNTVDSLRATIVNTCMNMNRDHLKSACERFRTRVEKVIEAKGGWIE